MINLNVPFPDPISPSLLTKPRRVEVKHRHDMMPMFIVRMRISGSAPERLGWTMDETTARRFADLMATWFDDTVAPLNYSIDQVLLDIQTVPLAVAMVEKIIGCARPERVTRGRKLTFAQRVALLEQRVTALESARIP